MINAGMYKFYMEKIQFRAKLEGRNFCPQKIRQIEWTSAVHN